MLLTFTNAYSGNDFDWSLSLNVPILFQKKSNLRSEGQETVLCNAKHYRHYKLINLQDWTPAVLSQGALHSLRFYSVRTVEMELYLDLRMNNLSVFIQEKNDNV